MLLAPMLPLAACAGTWPRQSYVSMPADADAVVLAPAISDCIAEIVSPLSAITLPALPNDPVEGLLTTDLGRNGLKASAGGIAVAYVVAPLDTGVFIRVVAAKSSCSQFFYRGPDALHVGGPQMVALHG